MNLKINRIQFSGLILIIICLIYNCSFAQNPIMDSELGLKYLKGLEGKWEVQGGKEGLFGWEFDLTSRGNVIIERLKVGTPTEMTTIYHLDEENLIGKHYCQLQNQPNLSAVNSEKQGDLHFLCNGTVGNTHSHDELHMHGIHFQKKDSSLMIWMDMNENGKLAFETRYELFRVDSTGTQESFK